MTAEDRMLEHADRLQAERDEWKRRALAAEARPPIDGPWTNAPHLCCDTLSDEDHKPGCAEK